MKNHPLVRHHRRIVWIVLIVAICPATIAVTLLIREAMRENDLPPTEPPLVTASPTPTVATGTPAAAATPTVPVPPAVVPGSLADLMRYAPDRLADGSLPLPEVATYTDISTWLHWQPDPELPLTEIRLADLPLPPIIANRALDPIWKATYGFSLVDVDQFLAIGQSPDYIFIMRGNFDEDTLKRAWVGSSYQAVAYKGVTIWTTFPGDTIDLSNPASRPAMGSLNNILLLDEHTMIAAAKFSRVQDVVRVIQGETGSLAGNDDMTRLLGLETSRQRFVTAVIGTGELIESAPRDQRRAGDVPLPQDALPHMVATPVPQHVPEVRMCLFGMLIEMEQPSLATPAAMALPAAPPQFTIALVFHEDDANQAVLAIRHRFRHEVSSESGIPWNETFDLLGGIRTGDGLVVLHLTAKSGTIDWLHMLNDRDFGFLTWQPENGDS